MSRTLPKLVLRKNEERRLLAGHSWIYSNEVDTGKSPLVDFQPGDAVAVLSASGRQLGSAYVNPHSLICARLYSRSAHAVLDEALLERRLRVALELRERLFDQPCYRLVFGESDGLPGLVIDRYDAIFVVQLATAGMERVRGALLETLHRMFDPAGIVLRNDSPVRLLEGLTQEVEVLGAVPEIVTVEEGGVQFRVPLLAGQKTGWFFDQRANRHALLKYVPGQDVLDLFSYVGAWGLQAARAGARTVTCVDASATALESLQQSAALNELQERVTIQQGDAFAVLQSLRDAGRQFGVVVVDPPAFIKRRKDMRKGEQGYARINEQAISLLAPGGILISCSCSMHLPPERLQQLLLQAATRQGRRLQLLERGFQAIDHPVHPAIAETAYLKALFCRVGA
jgi:23S rRNA (cytosine1962-C5)-methyltransferase